MRANRQQVQWIWLCGFIFALSLPALGQSNDRGTGLEAARAADSDASRMPASQHDQQLSEYQKRIAFEEKRSREYEQLRTRIRAIATSSTGENLQEGIIAIRRFRKQYPDYQTQRLLNQEKGWIQMLQGPMYPDHAPPPDVTDAAVAPPK